jgi:hypothetical protein
MADYSTLELSVRGFVREIGRSEGESGNHHWGKELIETDQELKIR